MPEQLICRREHAILLKHVVAAHHFFSRLRGLLGRRQLALDEGLWIRPCHSVHTLGMRFAIAVVFLDHEQRILRVLPELPPGRLSPVVAGARSVLELHPDTCRASALSQGEHLDFVPRVPGQPASG